MVLVVVIILGLNSSKASSQQRLKPMIDSGYNRISIKVLPQNFYKQNLGFFCKKEVQIQQAIKLPLYFRLGSKQHTDYLERKPNSYLQTKGLPLFY